jgi:hypothetical protein
VAYEITLESAESGLRGLSAAAHLAEADQAVIRLHLDDCANEPAPVAAVSMPERRFKRDSDGGCSDISYLHTRPECSTPQLDFVISYAIGPTLSAITCRWLHHRP